jgi:uncharacterized membrane protein
MSARLLLVVAVAGVTYATRIAGFNLGGRGLSPAMRRFLEDVPVAAFAALLAPGLAGSGGIGPRLLGATVAVLVALRLGLLWAGIVAGMAGFWLARAALG